MENTCRLCSLTSISLQSVFSVINERLLLDMITIVCPIKIEKNDNFPQGICSLCLKIILDANALRTKSVQTDLKLRSTPFTIVAPEVVSIKSESVHQESNFSINYIEDSYDESSRDDDNDNDYEASMESDEKRLKIDKVHTGPTFSRSNLNLNEKVKSHFQLPDTKGGKWLCRLCGKLYAGNVNNLKDHLAFAHKETAATMGIMRKSKGGGHEVFLVGDGAFSNEFNSHDGS